MSRFRPAQRRCSGDGSTRSSSAAAENQAFLVECVAGAETLKAMAIEPQSAAPMGGAARRLRRLQLPGDQPRNTTSQIVQLINKLVVAGILYFGAKAGHRRRPHRRRTGRLQPPGRSRQRAGVAPRPDLAGLPPGAPVGPTAGRYPQHPRPSRSTTRAARRCPRSAATSRSSMSPSATGSTGRKCCTTSA